LRIIQDTINTIAASARWGLVIDHGQMITPDSLLESNVLHLTQVYQQLLNQIIELVQQGIGRELTKQVVQHSYDSLPWQARELTAEYIFHDTLWGDWLSQQFKNQLQGYKRLLSHIPTFFHCTADEIDEICAHLEERAYTPGSKIIRQGDVGNEFYVVKSGKVAVWQRDEQGWDRLVNEHSRGGTFGELALLHDAPRNATCIAATSTTVLALKRKAFQSLVRRHFEIEGKVNQSIRYTQILRDIPLFDETSTEQLKQIAARLRSESLDANQVFVHQGEEGDKFYIIEQGQVEAFTVDDEGQEKTVAHRGSGEYVGEIALLLNVPRTANLRTVTATTMLTLTRDDFLGLMMKDLEIQQHLERASSRRLLGLSQNRNAVEPVTLMA
jgi:CRP-like cAMP-binding protein